MNNDDVVKVYDLSHEEEERSRESDTESEVSGLMDHDGSDGIRGGHNLM